MSMPRALVVEDDLAWQQLMAEMLGDEGFEVDLASDLAGAEQYIRQAAHRVAVVDLSLAAPDHRNEDGLRVLSALRRHDPACRSVLLTGFATVELAVSALTQYNAFGFLRKENFQRAQFREIVDRIRASAPELPPLNAGPASHPQADTVTEFVVPTEVALVVDDDAGWRSIITELLMDSGFSVRPCASFGEALGYLRRENFTLSVIDLSLTGVGGASPNGLEGYELLTIIQAETIPTIVVSGVASVDEIRRTYDQQAVFAFIEKQTFERGAFRRTVQEARASRELPKDISELTERELEVLRLLAQGKTNKEIAEMLVITTNTVKRHLKAIFGKLDVHTRAAAAARAISVGMGSADDV